MRRLVWEKPSYVGIFLSALMPMVVYFFSCPAFWGNSFHSPSDAVSTIYWGVIINFVLGVVMGLGGFFAMFFHRVFRLGQWAMVCGMVLFVVAWIALAAGGASRVGE
jgi:hypothetical protein